MPTCRVYDSHLVSFIPEAVGTYYISVRSDRSGRYGHYYVGVANIQDDHAGQAGAGTATVGGTVTGYIERIR